MCSQCLNNAHIQAHTKAFWDSAKRSFSPLVEMRSILYQILQKVQTVSRHPLKGLLGNEWLSESVFPSANTSTPGLLITEVTPAGKWTERLWEGDRDERQF